VWNRRAEDLWGVRADEAVGAPFLSLDIGLPVAELGQPIREVMSGQRPGIETTTTATTRKGRSIKCRVSVTPLTVAQGGAPGVILLMEEDSGVP